MQFLNNYMSGGVVYSGLWSLSVSYSYLYGQHPCLLVLHCEGALIQHQTVFVHASDDVRKLVSTKELRNIKNETLFLNRKHPHKKL